ncbi:MAG: peptidylprolyl isomerase, partial [Phycisphaerales bacterium]|nr:peptidylprolyl isomerase [Phycisphaerales bacterium]
FYAQLLVNGAPAGSPLVVQPLIERPVMYTRPDTRPDGTTTYTRITGWGDDPESLLPEDERGVSTTTPTPTGDPDTPPQPSGVRLYVEQDVILETELGDIRFSLRPDEAPNTAWNFLDLARHGFYRDTVLHRIVPLDRNGNPFVLQGGDPSATGDGGPGYWLPLEPSRLAHDFGVLSMARADDPDSAGSQYFIALSRAGTARLDGQYCAFGYAVLGGDVIKRLAQVEIADPARGRPVQPPAIRTARLVAAPSRAPGIGRPDRRVEADLPEPDITPAKPGRDRVPR